MDRHKSKSAWHGFVGKFVHVSTTEFDFQTCEGWVEDITDDGFIVMVCAGKLTMLRKKLIADIAEKTIEDKDNGTEAGSGKATESYGRTGVKKNLQVSDRRRRYHLVKR